MTRHGITHFTFCIVQDPLTLSLSPRGERTPEFSSERRFNSVPSPLGEKDRMRGSWTAHHPDLA
jgi:hypothetical protein